MLIRQRTTARRALVAATLAVLAAATAPATADQSAGRGTVYGGHLVAGSPYPVAIRLSAQGTAITRITSAFHAPCTSGLAFNLVDDSPVSAAIAPDGRFSAVHRPDPFELGRGVTATARVTTTGRVTGRRISGAIAVHVEEQDADGAVVATCDAAAPFRARSAPGRVYAGATSQNGPIVIELPPSRRQVRHLRVGWQSTCRTGAEFQVADDQGGFRVRDRRFGGEYDARPYEIDGGGEGVDHYAVRGRLGERKASGSFRVTTSEVDAEGRSTDACDSGPLTFRARTG